MLETSTHSPRRAARADQAPRRRPAGRQDRPRRRRLSHRAGRHAGVRRDQGGRARAGREQDSKAYLGPEGDMGFVHALMPYVFGAAIRRWAAGSRACRPPAAPARCGWRWRWRKRRASTRVLDGRAELAQPRADRRRPRARAGDLRPCRARRHRRHRRRCATAIAEARRGRRGPAPRLLPQPDRDRLHRRAVGRDRRGCWPTAGVLPILDLAYQGLGDGMEEDAYGSAHACSPRCPRRWSPTAATRTSASIATGSARST